jgi:uncharacterized protein involved in exopolysaccharide biosynthesis
VELLTSYDILETAVVQNHLAHPGFFFPGTEQENIDVAVRRLAKTLQVTPVRKANIIDVEYSARSPQLAAAVLRTIEGAYLEAHLRAQSTPGGYLFFEKQAAYYQKQLLQAQSALSNFSRTQNASNLEQQRTLLTQNISDLNVSLQQTQAASAQLQTEIEKSIAVEGTLSPRLNTTRSSQPNQYSVDHLTTLIAELENRRVAQTSKFREDDEFVKETDAEIAKTKQALQQAASTELYQETTDINPVLQGIQAGLESKRVQLAGLEAKGAVLRNQLSANNSVLNHLTDVSGNYDVLVANVQQAQNSYNQYAGRRELARVSGGLDLSKITNVVVAEEPTESLLPSSSHVLINLLLTLAFALCATATAVLIAEYVAPAYQEMAA